MRTREGRDQSAGHLSAASATGRARLLVNSLEASTDASCGFVVAEGQPTTIGLEVEGDDELRTQVTSLSLNVVLKHYQDSIFQESYSIGKDSAMMTTSSNGNLTFSISKVFQVAEFRQAALELCIGLVQQHRDPAQPKEDFDDEVSIRRLVSGQAPPRASVVQEASATIRIGSFARLSSRSYELTFFSSLLAITVHNMHASESLTVLSSSMHFRETLRAATEQVLQDLSEMMDNASSDLNDRFSATSSVVDISDLQELVEISAATHYVERVPADALYLLTPLVPCNEEPVVVHANESFTLAYMVRLRRADEAQQNQQGNRALIEALGEFSTPVTVRWSVGKMPPQLAKHHVQWSMGSSSLTSQSSGSPLDISLSAPSHAVCNKEFTVNARITNTSKRNASDLCVVTSNDGTQQQQQQHQRFICFQATTPLQELAPGESTQVAITILPVRAGHLQLSHIHIVHQGTKTYPRLSTTVVVTS